MEQTLDALLHPAPELYAVMAWAWAAHRANGDAFTLADIHNTASVMQLSHVTKQYKLWPGVGVMLWLRCSDKVFDWIKQRNWPEVFGASVVERVTGPNLAITETIVTKQGLVYPQIRQLTRQPGIQRLGGFRHGEWREHPVIRAEV